MDLENRRIDEFTVWGEFVKAWGFGVDTGAAELEVCTPASGCQAGIAGDDPGQLSTPLGIAVDSTGAVYVYDLNNARVTKYSPDGEFLLMFGGNVNETTGAEVCTAADVAGGDECGAGEAGSGPGFFEGTSVGNFIAASPTDTVYVGDKGRIQEFNPNGAFKGEIPFSGELTALAGVSPWGLAVDPDPVSGDIYVSTNRESDPIFRISPTGELVDEVEDTPASKTFPVIAAGIAVDSEGNLYAVDHRPDIGFNGPFEVLKFSPSGECLICGQKFAQQDTKTGLGRALMGLATSDACGIPGDDLYVPVNSGALAYLLSYGPAPQDAENCPPPEVPPSIEDQYAIDVGAADAELGARINPHFWNDTTYYVQYGPQACLDSGWSSDCSTKPLPPGDTLTDKVSNQAVATAGVELEGLEPDTVYHYRFVAQSSGGGPVIGIGGAEGSDGASSSFRTFPEPLAPKSDCTNQAFRTGPGALLADCRAYEMVSPVDKAGGDITTQKTIVVYPAELDLISLTGDTATYSSSTAFADALSSPYSSQYLARRDPVAGWQTHAISPPREELFRPTGKAELYELDVQFKLFSADLEQAWLMQEADPPLDSCGVENYINWYRRDNSPDGYEAITTKMPTKDPLDYFSEVQGASADGTRTIFRANDKLAVDEGPEAASISGYQLYEHVAEPGGCGKTRLVSVLPAGTASALESSAGTAASGIKEARWIEARENLVHNAVSEDGEVVYWTAGADGPGQLYVRVGGTTTSKVSAGTNARFWSAAADGGFAYYTEGEKLFRYTLASKTAAQVATGVLSLVGASEDAQRAYFASNKSIGGEGTNGQPNLYLFDEGTVAFIATLSAKDVVPSIPLTPVTSIPVRLAASLSEDGRFLAFTSDQSLTGADNLDAASGLPDTEAFLYEADGEELRCLSCSFTGARPAGRTLEGINKNLRGYASRIPPWKNQFHAPRVISADGSRVFFESLARLVPRDENGAQDVYMWTRASDQASCEAAGQELYNPIAGGCIALISSATGAGDAEFVDATPDTSDVFFKTPESLVSRDPSRIDLYDARVGGGFPPPTEPDPCAVPENCPERESEPKSEPIGSGSGPGNPDFSACRALEAKARKAHAKAVRLKHRAVEADGARAAKLRRQAKARQKQAKHLAAGARGCYSKLGGK